MSTLDSYLQQAVKNGELSDRTYGVVVRLLYNNHRFKNKYPDMTLDKFTQLVLSGELGKSYQIGATRLQELQKVFSHNEAQYRDVSQLQKLGIRNESPSRYS